jgi:HSP20 family protein
MSVQSPHQPPDGAELGHDVRRLLEELAQSRPDGRPLTAGECLPSVDVLETDRAVEVVLDIPGVPIDRVRILLKGDIVLVVGEKERPHPTVRLPASFHLVERDFGRFARAVRIHVPIDAGRATATLVEGELRIVLPKLEDRRGRGYRIPITSGRTGPA